MGVLVVYQDILVQNDRKIFMQNNLNLYRALCSLRHLKSVFGEEKEDTLGSGT